MIRKLFSIAVGLLFIFIFSNLPLPAQEQSGGDISDISLDELLNVQITTAGKKAEKISEIPASVVLITRDDIKKYGYETLEEILENVPGMYTIDDFFWVGSQGYGVRGFFATGAFKDMIIMVNGVSQMDDNFDSYPTGFIPVPVEAIDRIEIVRGPMSVIYGSGAFFGSINIITNQETDKPINILAVGGGSQNTSKIFGRASGVTGDMKYSFNAGIYRTKGIDVAFSDMTSDMEGLSANTNLPLNSKTGGMLTDHRKFVNFTSSIKNFFIDFSHSFVEKGMIDGLPGVGYGHIANLNATNVTFGYKKKFSEKFTLNSSIHYRNGENYADYSYFTENNYGLNRIKNDAFEVFVDAFLNPSPMVDITIGMNFRNTINNEAQYDVPDFGAYNFDFKILRDEDQKKGSIYTQINFKPIDRLKFTAGVRVEKIWDYNYYFTFGQSLEDQAYMTYHYNPDKLNVVPRVAAIFSVSDRHVFKLMYGQAIKNPSFGENADIMFYQGLLPDLEPAKIDTIEFNYLSAISSKINFNVSVFYNKLDKLISRANYLTPDGPVWVTTNSGKMTTVGFESGLQFLPIDNLKFDFNVTYQKSKDKRDGFEDIEPGYAPKILGYGKVDLKLKNISIALIGRYIDKMYSRYDDVTETRIGNTIESYFVMNGNINIKDIIYKGLFLSLKVYNIFDQEIRYPTTDSNIWADKGYLGRSRSFLMTAGYEF